jgi:hypothetical protein
MLSSESRRVAGILLVVFPSVQYGGVSLLMFLIDRNSGYMDNPLRQNLFRAGHAHAGVLLVLSLIALRYVDDAQLSDGWKRYVRSSIPAAAILCRRLHLSGIGGSGGAGDWATDAGSGAAEKYYAILKPEEIRASSRLHWAPKATQSSARAPGSA